MQGAWFQQILTELWTLPRELGRLPEYAAEAERLHREIHAGETLLLLGVVDTGGGRPDSRPVGRAARRSGDPLAEFGRIEENDLLPTQLNQALRAQGR